MIMIIIMILLWSNVRLATIDGLNHESQRLNSWSNNMKEFPSAKDCYFKLEERKQFWIDEWLEDNFPILDSVLWMSKNVYYISIIVKHLMNSKNDWNNETWYCNRIDNPGKLLVSNTPVHLIECRMDDESDERLHSIWPSKVSSRTNRTLKYDSIDMFTRCDRLELQESPPLLSTKTSRNESPTLGACAIVRDVGYHIPPWIEYHKLMGVDHFWIFVNEPFPKKEWIQRPYITYIPYNFYWYDHSIHSSSLSGYRKPKNDVFWQEAMQMKCLYNAKRLGNIEWLTTTDIDEYIWVNSSRYIGEPFPFKKYLMDHKQEFTSLAGLSMNSVFFGRHPNEATTTDHSNDTRWLMIDYTYRASHPKWQRYKVIYRPEKAQVAEVHTAKGGKSLQLQDVYFHHYKKPSQGVAKTTGQDTLMMDTGLRDGYRDTIWNILQKDASLMI